ncbi:MAG: hypothetical protein HXS47_03855 [Theionarchaea archaeon]|nr:hypothetical protein [Theionarchaea archaeon]
MSVPKWFIVARNEYRIKTSSIRQIRPYLPYIVIALLALYVFYIAPTLVGAIENEILELFLSQVAVVLVKMLFVIFFFMFITFPISQSLKDVQTQQQYIFLSAPITPGHVLLGEFLGTLPIYAIFIVLLIGIFTALMVPLGLSLIQILLIVITFVMIFSTALWIGTVISSLLRTRLGKTSRGQDIGKALSLIIVLPVIGFMYWMMGGGLADTFVSPGGGITETVVGLVPSSWGADMLSAFVSSPGNISAVWEEVLIKFGGLCVFTGAVFAGGMMVADRAYSLETTSFISACTNPDSGFSHAIQTLGGGGSFGILLASIFKVYGRRLQNISWIAYIVGLFTIMNLFLIKPEDSMDAMAMGLFIFPMLAVVVSCDITLRGKETLFLYRKAPGGENRLVKGMVLKGWMVAVPIAVLITAASTYLSPQGSVESLVKNVGIVGFMVTADIAFALGLFLLMPAYTEKGGEFALNLMIVIFTSIGLFAVAMSVFDTIFILPVLHWCVGPVILYLGKIHLSAIE